MSSRKKRDHFPTSKSPTRSKDVKVQPDSDKAAPVSVEPVLIRESQWSCLLQSVFFLFAFWFLCLVNRNYLFLLQEYNLFLYSFPFFWRHFTYVGGPLDYGASFLAQFFLYPVLGGGILVLLLFFIRKLTENLFFLKGNRMILSFVPSLFLIRFFTQPGYIVFFDIRTDTLYAAFIGVFLAFSLAAWYSLIISPVRRGIFGSLGTILLYYFTGVYGLWGALLCLFCECFLPREKRRFLCSLFPILCGILVPFFSFYLQLTKTNLIEAYFVGLPCGTSRENSPLLSEFLILLSSILFLAGLQLVWNIPLIGKVFHHKRQIAEKDSSTRKNGIPLRFAALNVVLLVLLCCAVYTFSHARGDFLITAKMCRLACEENWEGILQIQYQNEKPMFPIVLFRQLALFKLDRIAEEVFTWPTISQAEEGPLKDFLSSRVLGDHILFEYGLTNMAFRMAMIQYSLKESTISNLRILALSAMANEEYEVAKKYLRLIKQTLFYHDWAQNHIEFIESHELSNPRKDVSRSSAVIAIDRRLEKIRRLMPVVNEIESNRKIDALIEKGFLRENIEEASREVQEMYLVQLLMYKDLASFHKYFDLWADELYADHIPRHFKEALIMEPTPEAVENRVAQYNLSPDWGQKYFQFMSRLEAMVQPGDTAISNTLIHQEFGDTFWYYYASE